MSSKLIAGNATSGSSLSADTTGILEIQTGSGPTTAITVDASQNVGIGTSSPVNGANLTTLTVYNATQPALFLQNSTTGTTATDGLSIGMSGTDCYFNNRESGNIITYVNGSERMRIDSSGNVGIGTSSIGTATKLQVAGRGIFTGGASDPADGSPAGVVLGYNTASSYGFIQAIQTGVATKDLYIQPTGSNNIIVGAGGGNLLINTTSLNSGKVNIVASGSAQPCMIWNDSDATSASQGIVSIRRNGTAVGLISTTNTNTTYATSSDYRLKENIAPMTGALATVSALKPVTYKWKSTGEESQGFIAHELQAVVPDCVTGEKDAVETIDDVDAEGKVIGTKEVPKYQGIDTSFLVATLTAAIQELNAKVDAQAAEIKALKGVA